MDCIVNVPERPLDLKSVYFMEEVVTQESSHKLYAIFRPLCVNSGNTDAIMSLREQKVAWNNIFRSVV